MALEDFEKELAGEKSRESSHRSQREHHQDRDRDRSHRHGHHHHRSHPRGDESRDEERRRQRKRRHDHRDDEERRHRKRRRSESPARPQPAEHQDIKVFDSPAEDDDDEDEWVEKEAVAAPPEEDILDQRDQNLKSEKLQRDAWMQEPSALEVEYVSSRKPKVPAGQFVGAKDDHSFKVHNQHIAELERDFASDGEDDAQDNNTLVGAVKDQPPQHDVHYTFGDAGSSWRMTKLKAVYRQAEESGGAVDDIALERYGDLRDFDDAREEQRELDRRKMYGKEYVGLEKPSGDLFQERKMEAGMKRRSRSNEQHSDGGLRQSATVTESDTQSEFKAAPVDTTTLNKLKAQLMKGRLRKAPNLAQLEEEYRLAEKASLAAAKQSDVVVLNDVESRMLASGRQGEVTAVSGKRGRERGLVVENEDMSIEDMVRQERRTKGGAEGKAFAERIAKDGKFVDDLDYMDENAEKLSKKVIKSDSNLRNAAVGDFQKMQRALEHCPLCHHEDRSGADALPVAPVVSLATRTYLTLATEPEMIKGGVVIVPIQHRMNLLECDEDEWEEMRNFMKSLIRHYDAQDKGVVFYENAAHMHSRRGHAALNAVPLPRHLADTAPAYFKEAILASSSEWSQHKPIIDTLTLSQKAGYGKQAFRKAMVKEMPYFHVFFTLDGGMGHVIEDERKWPKGDLFTREILGGMLDRGPETIKKQGRWERGDRRVDGLRKKWAQWDWTKALMEVQ